MMDSVRIDRLGHLGDGIASDGRFVPYTLPGEHVAVGPPLRILEPAPDRVKPICRHFGTCGGCALQHASDRFLADWKTDVVRRALDARDLDAPFRPAAVSPPASRRRTVLSARRTKSGALIGYHARASDQIVAVGECPVLRPALAAIIPRLVPLVRLGASRKGELKITATESGTGVDLAVEGGKPLDRALGTALADTARALDLARLSWGGETVALRRPPVQILGRARVVPPPGAFLQATAEGAAALAAGVLEAVAGARTVADLFSGIGTFTLPLAERVDVHAVEAEAAMLDALDAGWRGAGGLHRVTTETRDLFRRPLLPAELGHVDAVVMDPPRAGAEAQARALADSRVRRVAMVSCNPVSFARDLQILVAGGFGIDWVQPVDQFRWSPHVELVASVGR